MFILEQKRKRKSLLADGAKWAGPPTEIAQNANVIITMVSNPSDVEGVYLGEQGLVHYAKPGSYLIDMTTSKPSLAEKIYQAAKEKGIAAIDAPVSGGDIGARDAKLSIMVGGEEEDFEAIRPILEVMGNQIVYQGPAGAGQHTKMCNQITVATNMIGITEALVYAEKSGLDPERVLQSITTGAAGSWSLSNLVPRMMKGDFAPGFYIKHFIKDMNIALEEAEKIGMNAPGLSLSKSMYEQLAEAVLRRGWTKEGFSWSSAAPIAPSKCALRRQAPSSPRHPRWSLLRSRIRRYSP